MQSRTSSRGSLSSELDELETPITVPLDLLLDVGKSIPDKGFANYLSRFTWVVPEVNHWWASMGLPDVCVFSELVSLPNYRQFMYKKLIIPNTRCYFKYIDPSNLLCWPRDQTVLCFAISATEMSDDMKLTKSYNVRSQEVRLQSAARSFSRVRLHGEDIR